MAKKSDAAGYSKSPSRSGRSSLFSSLFQAGLFVLTLKILLVLFLGLGAYWIATTHPETLSSIKNKVDGYLNKFVAKESEIATFEIAYNQEDILALTKGGIKEERYSVGDPRLLYSPCLIVNVKHVGQWKKSTEESTMVWDLMAGELFLSLDTFQVTSGFRDCIASQADVDEFRILHVLSENGGAMTKEALLQRCGLQEDRAVKLIEALRSRHLVALSHDMVRLHVKNPLFMVEPATKISAPFVQRVVSTLDLIPELYTRREIERLVVNAYGKDLAILDSEFVWIPVWEVPIHNPDGSLRKIFWNAVSGKQILGKPAQALRHAVPG